MGTVGRTPWLIHVALYKCLAAESTQEFSYFEVNLEKSRMRSHKGNVGIVLIASFMSMATKKKPEGKHFAPVRRGPRDAGQTCCPHTHFRAEGLRMPSRIARHADAGTVKAFNHITTFKHFQRPSLEVQILTRSLREVAKSRQGPCAERNKIHSAS